MSDKLTKTVSLTPKLKGFFSSHDSASSIAAVTKLAEENRFSTLSIKVNKHQPSSANQLDQGRSHYSGGLDKFDCKLEGSHCLAYLLKLSASLGTL